MPFTDDVRDAHPDPLTDWPAFTRAVRARLAAGERQYGTATFERPLPEIADGLAAEILDQAAYAFIAWTRLVALRERLSKIERAAAQEHSK